jgi:hypothetical protein
MLLDERQDVLLLVVKVLEQRGAVLGERADQRGRRGRRGRGSPGGHALRSLRQGPGDHLVLDFHPQHQVRFQVDPGQQQRPDELVLAGMVEMQP